MFNHIRSRIIVDGLIWWRTFHHRGITGCRCGTVSISISRLYPKIRFEAATKIPMCKITSPILRVSRVCHDQNINSCALDSKYFHRIVVTEACNSFQPHCKKIRFRYPHTHTHTHTNLYTLII